MSRSGDREPVTLSEVEYFTDIKFDAPHETPISYNENEPFEILEFGPTGELPVEVRRPTIYIVFSKPMVPLARLGETMREHDSFTFYPTIEGIFRWEGSRILSFQPDAPMTAQREYTVSVHEDTTAVTGQKLDRSFELSFFRKHLDFVDVRPGSPEMEFRVDRNNAHPEEARYITAEFTYPVNMEFIADFLELKVDGVSVDAGFFPASPHQHGRQTESSRENGRSRARLPPFRRTVRSMSCSVKGPGRNLSIPVVPNRGSCRFIRSSRSSTCAIAPSRIAVPEASNPKRQR